MGVNRLTGTPWHVEKIHRADGDERRYKGRCAYYSYENNRCSYLAGKCTGSARCTRYKAISEEEFKKRQKANQRGKSNFDDDIYWF